MRDKSEKIKVKKVNRMSKEQIKERMENLKSQKDSLHFKHLKDRLSSFD